MKLTLFHDPGFAAPIGTHIMPIAKFALVAEEVARWDAVTVESPLPIDESHLLQVHTPEYINAIQCGDPRELAESQKFPWSPELYPSVLLTNGGVLAAARNAMETGVSGALASGFHHSFADHGEGFCTFNGLIIAAETLRAEGHLRSVAILDLDLHYGNGTASLAAERPWVRALSIYGNDYTNNTHYRDVSQRRHEDGQNHISVPLIPGSHDALTLHASLEEYLPWLIAEGLPDLLLFQAGADPLRDDPYSPLDLGHDDLLERDRAVFGFARAHGIPVAWVLAGGYSRDITRIVEVHLNTARACMESYNLS